MVKGKNRMKEKMTIERQRIIELNGEMMFRMDRFRKVDNLS